VRRLLQEAAASVKPQLLAREIALEVRESELLRRMWGDRKRVAQVMAILLSNAIKFSNKGGRITIGAELVEATRGEVAISVEDTGIGIDQESQKRVFDKFFQADSSRTRRYEGAGIGLSIAKSIMDAHRGSIALQSKPNEGSTFTLLFPDAYFDDRQNSEPPDRLSNTSVLLIAGDVEITSALKRVLTGRAFDVTHASSGFEAARLVQEIRPGFIIINEESPSLNPVATAQQLIDSGIDDDTGILVLSEGPGLAESALAIHSRCPVDVLGKPFSASEFISRVERLHESPILPFEDDSANRAQGTGQIALLCISPDGDLQEWIETAMLSRDFACVRASNADEALTVIDERAPCAVLADLDVPERDVAILLGEVRVAAKHAGCAFHVMTGLSEEDWIPQDVTGVLRKPFSTRGLVETVTVAVASSLGTPSTMR
jgi:DNA-binding response OmpR family regulator